jgi:type II secretion system protein E
MRKRIGEILLEKGSISETELDDALGVQKSEEKHRRLGEILIGRGLSEDRVYESLSAQFSIPVLDSKDFPQGVPLERISFNFLINNLILPVELRDNVLKVAIGDPTNREGIDSLRASYGFKVDIFLASKSDILKHLEQLRESRSAVMQRLIDDVSQDDVDNSDLPSEISHLRDLAQEKGIIQLVNVVIENAVKDRASDIHIEPGEFNVTVRYRVDGVLHEKEILPARMYSAVSSRIKLLSQMNIAERRLPQDGRINVSVLGKAVDIRASTIPTIYGESIVMRLLDKGSSFIGLEEIGFDEVLLDIYGEEIIKSYGMVLITGPTGSGKSTTLYASLAKINSPEKKIITVEEPVEYLMQGINQIQVRPKIGLTFANGLRHIVRQDPDIIMVGEIRDLETASIAIHAALTGHLLFSTLHTNDAAGAVTRLMDMGVENYLVSSTLLCVMAQRLVRRICNECRKRYEAPEDLVKKFNLNGTDLWIGSGCDHCSGTGYRGRIGIFELLIITDEIRKLIMQRSTAREIKDKAVSLGMRSLHEDGMVKVKKGITTVDEVVRVTQEEI